MIALPVHIFCAPASVKREYPYIKEKKIHSNTPLTEEDKVILTLFVADLATSSMEDLLKSGKESQEKLLKFKEISPFTLASFLISDPNCYQNIRTVLQTEQKLIPFLFILSIKIKEAKDEGSIDQSITDFAQLFELDRRVIKRHIDREEYRELVKYMFSL